MIPKEVREILDWNFSFSKKYVPDKHVHWVAKSELSRGEAWEQINRNITSHNNPWRKCHTENYWVWYREPQPIC